MNLTTDEHEWPYYLCVFLLIGDLEIKRLALGLVTHPVINEDKGSHRFDDRYCAWHDAGIMTAAPHQLGFVAVFVDGVLFLDECSGWLKSDAEDQLLAITDATLHAT